MDQLARIAPRLRSLIRERRINADSHACTLARSLADNPALVSAGNTSRNSSFFSAHAAAPFPYLRDTKRGRNKVHA